MPCDTYRLGDNGVAIICSRGRSRAKPCSVTGCPRKATKLCDFKLRGAKEGKTCDRDLCDVHAISQGRQQLELVPGMSKEDSIDYCPAHDKLAREETSDAGGSSGGPGADTTVTASRAAEGPKSRAAVSFEIPEGTPRSQCKRCPAVIFFVKNDRTGNWMPLNGDGTSHFATCSHAHEFRRAR